ncbi:MAG: ATP-binding cassette domain-containing protein [Treponema sp.]|nr:ATP-binding cassette domain-containing protein [Treponema sp.]
MKNFTLNKKAVFLSAILLAMLWQFGAAYINAPLILPSPKNVFLEIINLLSQKEFLLAMLSTARRCLLAFLISATLGAIIGSLCVFFPLFASFIEFPMALIRSIPIVALILLSLFWINSDEIPMLAAVLMSLPVMKTCIQEGFSSCNKDLLVMAQVYRLSPSQKFLFIRIPEAFPSLSSGIKSCAGMIWKVTAAGEVLSLPKRALGTYLQNAQSVLETQRVFAVTAVIVTLSFLCSIFINFLTSIAGKTGITFTKCYFKGLSLFSKNKVKPTIIPQKINIKELNLGYDSIIFKNFSLNVDKSEILAILAPSGCGKTTLLNYIAKQSSESRIAYIFQEPRIIKSLTVMQNIMLPLLNIMNIKEAQSIAKNYIEKTGLKGKENSFFNILSGGERQRVSIARAFAYPSGTLLMDEPFQSMDEKTKTKVITLFIKFEKEQKRTVIMTTHIKKEAEQLADKIMQLSGRPIKANLITKN